jgi:hypothetical protein
MRYLITTPEHPPFFAAWFAPENHFAPGMAVYDLQERKFATDCVTWQAIEPVAPKYVTVVWDYSKQDYVSDPAGAPIEFPGDADAEAYIQKRYNLSSDEREARFSLEQIRSER